MLINNVEESNEVCFHLEDDFKGLRSYVFILCYEFHIELIWKLNIVLKS